MISYFQPLITNTSEISPLSVIIGDKEYDSEDNLTLVSHCMCLVLYGQDVYMNQYEGPVGDTQNK
jgi:hypothetical protein